MTALVPALWIAVALGQATAPAQAQAEAPPTQESPARPVLTLEAAMDQAREKNQDLAVVRARLEQAWEISKRAWSGYLPQISVGGAYTRNNVGAQISLPTGYYIRDLGSPQGPPFDPTQPPSVANPPGGQTSFTLVPSGLQTATIQKRDMWSGQAQFVQPLIVPPLWAGIHGAFVAQKAAELNVENARRETLFAVAQLYYGAVALRETAAVQQRLLDINRQRTRDAEVKFEAGAVPKVFLLRAQIDLARAEQDVRRARFSYASAKSSLAALLDREPDFEVAPPPEPVGPSAPPAELEDNAPLLRPDVLAAKQLALAAEDSHRSSWLKYFPTVAFTARYQIANVTGFIGRPDSWAFIVGANWTILDGGLREAELRENAARINETRAAHRSAELRVKDEVRRALYDLESARANRLKAEEQLRLAKENLQLVKVNSDAGAATYLEVSDATANLLQAELAVVAEGLNAQLSVLKLARAAGHWKP